MLIKIGREDERNVEELIVRPTQLESFEHLSCCVDDFNSTWFKHHERFS